MNALHFPAQYINFVVVCRSDVSTVAFEVRSLRAVSSKRARVLVNVCVYARISNIRVPACYALFVCMKDGLTCYSNRKHNVFSDEIRCFVFFYWYSANHMWRRWNMFIAVSTIFIYMFYITEFLKKHNFLAGIFDLYFFFEYVELCFSIWFYQILPTEIVSWLSWCHWISLRPMRNVDFIFFKKYNWFSI